MTQSTNYRKDGSKPSFTMWVKSHHKQDNAIGDLARDMNRDKEMDCRKIKTYQQARFHLEMRNACDRAIEALYSAYLKYQKL